MASSPLFFSSLVLASLLLFLPPSHSSSEDTKSEAKEPASPVVSLKHSAKLNNVAKEPAPAVISSGSLTSTNPAPPAITRKLSSSGNHFGLAKERASPVTSRKFGSEPGKVDLSLYYETLCPFCRDFIVNPLAQAVYSDLFAIVNLKLVPWGNAYLQPNNTIICQHGEDECYLNIIQACAIDLWPDVKKHFGFIHCVEQSVGSQGGVQAVWEACARQLGLPEQDIQYCYSSGRGKQLALRNGRQTASLNPPLKYVPWVIVNGTPLLTDYGNFVDHVCRSYRGTTKPRACHSRPNPTTSMEEEKPLQQLVCLGR